MADPPYETKGCGPEAAPFRGVYNSRLYWRTFEVIGIPVVELPSFRVMGAVRSK